MTFLRVLPKNYLWSHYSGVPEAWGPRFIEPPEPTPTPLGLFLQPWSPHGAVLSESKGGADTQIMRRKPVLLQTFSEYAVIIILTTSQLF